MELSAELCSIRRTRRLVNGIIWILVAGATVFSVMTSTPLVQDHSQWKWSGWILGALTDAALVLSLSADSVLSRHGVSGGRWTVFFRWTTGAASVFLNVTDSAIHGDGIGVVIHSIAPVLLIGASEAAPIYRRRFRDLEDSLSRDNRDRDSVTGKRDRDNQRDNRDRDNVTNERDQESVTVTGKRDRDSVTSKRDNVTSIHAKSRVTSRRDHQAVTSVTSDRDQKSVTSKRDLIRDCFDRGMSPTDTAKMVGCDRSYVSRQFKALRSA